MPPRPKEPSLVARRNKTSTRAVLKPRANPKIPALPKGIRWHQQVRDWWKRAWSSPMVPEWTESDIDALYMAARLMQMLWSPESSPNECKALAGEIRQLLAQCGLTPMSRRSLQWEIERGEAAAESTAQRRTKAVPAKKTAARPDPRAARANLHAV
ncbi:phage terminase small subunit [Mycolicibacterium brisbanense]